jgi:hypothetical protein
VSCEQCPHCKAKRAPRCAADMGQTCFCTGACRGEVQGLVQQQVQQAYQRAMILGAGTSDDGRLTVVIDSGGDDECEFDVGETLPVPSEIAGFDTTPGPSKPGGAAVVLEVDHETGTIVLGSLRDDE